MKPCYRTGWCRDCPHRIECPTSIRSARRARRSKQTSASKEMIRKAAQILSTGWFTAYELGCALHGTPQDTMLKRKSVAVRARRVLNRLMMLDLLMVRPGINTGIKRIGASYRLVPDGMEGLP